MGTPTAERPPQGLTAHWLGVWRHALKVLKDQDTWKWEQAPLLAEYVEALAEADLARKTAKAQPYRTSVQGVEHPHPGFAQADRAAKRAAALADLLLLTEKSRRDHGIYDDRTDPDEGDQAGL